MAVIQSIKSLMATGYRIQPCRFNVQPKEPFLGYDEEFNVYIRSSLLYDEYTKHVMTSKPINRSALYQLLADSHLINANEKRWLHERKGHNQYIYSRNSGKKQFYTLRFYKQVLKQYGINT